MGSMIPCYDCFSEDGIIDYGNYPKCQYPCCDCESKKYKKCEPEICKSINPKCERFCDLLRSETEFRKGTYESRT